MRGGLAALEPRDGPQAPLKPTQATPLDGRFACLSGGRDGGDKVRFIYISLWLS
jgi:hypothetical protein